MSSYYYLMIRERQCLSITFYESFPGCLGSLWSVFNLNCCWLMPVERAKTTVVEKKDLASVVRFGLEDKT